MVLLSATFVFILSFVFRGQQHSDLNVFDDLETVFVKLPLAVRFLSRDIPIAFRRIIRPNIQLLITRVIDH